MRGASYLRQIAAPAPPGLPALMPLRAPAPDEARPAARAPAPAASARPRTAVPATSSRPPAALPADAPVSAAPPAALPSPAATQDDADGPSPSPVPGFPAAAANAAPPSLPPLSRTASAEQQLSRATDEPPLQLATLPSPPEIHAHSGPRIRIGTVEVRTTAPPRAQPAAAPKPTPPPATAASPTAPLSRGFGWRYGLAQS